MGVWVGVDVEIAVGVGVGVGVEFCESAVEITTIITVITTSVRHPSLYEGFGFPCVACTIWLLWSSAQTLFNAKCLAHFPLTTQFC